MLSQGENGNDYSFWGVELGIIWEILIYLGTIYIVYHISFFFLQEFHLNEKSDGYPHPIDFLNERQRGRGSKIDRPKTAIMMSMRSFC